MISEAGVYAAGAAVYAVSAVVSLVALRGVPASVRRYYYVATGLVVLGGVSSALLAAGVGTVTVRGHAVTLPSFAENLVTYSALWAITGLLADVDRRTLVVVTGLPFAQVIAFQVAALTGGATALAASAVVIGGHVVLAALFLGPVWRGSTHLPERRRLLHWKARNLLLFLIGMLIVFAFLSLAGVFDALGTVVLNQYVSVLIRVGFAAFLFANVDALATGRDGA
ncbi:MAG: rhodopsin, partial [Halobacterium sp.]